MTFGPWSKGDSTIAANEAATGKLTTMLAVFAEPENVTDRTCAPLDASNDALTNPWQLRLQCWPAVGDSDP